MANVKKSLEYTCIFGGGAIRGIAYVGAIKALEELSVEINTYAGSSVGAIFAGLLAVGYNAEELKEIFMQANYELFRDIHFGFAKDFALSKGEIFLDWIRGLIEKKYYGMDYNEEGNEPVTFADINKTLVIITTDLTNFKYKEFSKQETPNVEIAFAIRASASMPGLVKPVIDEENSAQLVDGDLQKSWPAWRLSKNLCPDDGRILEFRPEGDYGGKGQNAINFINTVYSCVTSIATDYVMDLYGYKDKFDYVKINTGSVVIVDFNQSKEKRQELIDIGYAQTIDYFNDALIEKKKKIVKHYKNVLKHLNQIKKCVIENRIKDAQNEIGQLYITLFAAKKYIDLKYVNMIEKFKENFICNLKSIPFVGICSLNNANFMKSQISVLSIHMEEKVMELESYIFKL